ncbi:hypothetical protein HPB47_015614 [Ixodes persulcatus]|uniref:Uncharacterized protein n=1 Tax=Ixodes persulcatus TaxID=34615 RepID=A0AC60QWL8_IXOPE|nr:hypothetical protein HPB47_015614 [Ixodes persulcatus]
MRDAPALTYRYVSDHERVKPLPVAILENPLPRGTFFTKVDLAEAYYNVSLSERSQKLTTFRLDSDYFCFTRLPFGLRPGPFVMQQLATAITCHLRGVGVWAWSHLDNFLLAHPDPTFLAKVTRNFIRDLELCGMRVNPKDTTKEPTQTIKFLGFLLEGKDDMLGHTGPRKMDITRILEQIQQPLPLKTMERNIGHLVFYFSLYRSHYHMLNPLFKLLHHPGSLPHGYTEALQRVWQVLLHRVPWRIPAPTEVIASDASAHDIGVATKDGNIAILTAPGPDIYVREAKALVIAALVAPPRTIILCDAAAVISAVTRVWRELPHELPWTILQPTVTIAADARESGIKVCLP